MIQSPPAEPTAQEKRLAAARLAAARDAAAREAAAREARARAAKVQPKPAQSRVAAPTTSAFIPPPTVAQRQETVSPPPPPSWSRHRRFDAQTGSAGTCSGSAERRRYRANGPGLCTRDRVARCRLHPASLSRSYIGSAAGLRAVFPGGAQHQRHLQGDERRAIWLVGRRPAGRQLRIHDDRGQGGAPARELRSDAAARRKWLAAGVGALIARHATARTCTRCRRCRRDSISVRRDSTERAYSTRASCCAPE